jgi:membrane fusion protein (multidrug efflux system)
MSESVRKVLLGAVIGAFVVGFAWHVSGERAKRAPMMQDAGGASAGAPTGTPQAASDGRAAGNGAGSGSGSGGSGGPVVRVVASPSRVERLALEIEALGTAHANESIEVTSKVSNLITAVRFVEGQHVRKGQVLVELDGEQERADLAVADAALTESASQLKRSRELYATKVLSDQQIEQIEATNDANKARVAAARSRLDDTVIRAPFAGRVGLRRVSVGSLIEPGALITTLDDTSRIKLDFTVSETAVAALEPGMSLQAGSVAYPGQTFAGRVASVDSRVNPDTRSVIVRGVLPNETGLLKPGMFLNVTLDRGESDVLTVPEESLLPEQGDVFVYVVDGGKASKRKIQTGQRRVGSVQVLSGLEPGELVVTEGTQKLRDGAAVEVVEAAVTPSRAASAAPPATSSAR